MLRRCHLDELSAVSITKNKSYQRFGTVDRVLRFTIMKSSYTHNLRVQALEPKLFACASPKQRTRAMPFVARQRELGFTHRQIASE